VPWRSAYRTVALLGGADKTFILGASGHIAGIVNPPAKKRRSHWVGKAYPADPEQWFSKAKEQQGSWWPQWSEWLEQHAGGRRAAPRQAGNRKFKPIEPAPGRYVKEKAH
jgi:polyhydroxyalkanoate synthase